MVLTKVQYVSEIPKNDKYLIKVLCLQITDYDMVNLGVAFNSFKCIYKYPIRYVRLMCCHRKPMGVDNNNNI